MKNLIKCEVCNKELALVNYLHLRKHNMTVKDYENLFPDAKLLSNKIRRKISSSTEKLWQDPDYSNSHIKGIRASHNTAEYKAKISLSHIESYKNNPERKERIRKKLLGHKVSDETKEKIRHTKTGVPSKKRGKSYNELFGVEKSKLIRQKLSELHKNKKFSRNQRLEMSKTHKRKFLDEEFRKQWAIRFHKKPSPLENKLIELINSNNIPFKYTGNLSTWIKSDIGVKNPDFVSSVGKNQVIELLGEYWHQKRPNIRFHQTAEGTLDHYKKAGFNCLIIWDYEVKRDPNAVLQKIKAFSESN